MQIGKGGSSGNLFLLLVLSSSSVLMRCHDEDDDDIDPRLGGLMGGLEGASDLQEAYNSLIDSQLPEELVAEALSKDQMLPGEAKMLAKALHTALKKAKREIDRLLATSKLPAETRDEHATAEQLKQLMPVVEMATANITAEYGFVNFPAALKALNGATVKARDATLAQAVLRLSLGANKTERKHEKVQQCPLSRPRKSV
eukprot:SAG31_NODE_5062_length_2765_cov_1.297074_4_plen_200_part_00